MMLSFPGQKVVERALGVVHGEEAQVCMVMRRSLLVPFIKTKSWKQIQLKWFCSRRSQHTMWWRTTVSTLLIGVAMDWESVARSVFIMSIDQLAIFTMIQCFSFGGKRFFGPPSKRQLLPFRQLHLFQKGNICRLSFCCQTDFSHKVLFQVARKTEQFMKLGLVATAAILPRWPFNTTHPFKWYVTSKTKI